MNVVTDTPVCEVEVTKGWHCQECGDAIPRGGRMVCEPCWTFLPQRLKEVERKAQERQRES